MKAITFFEEFIQKKCPSLQLMIDNSSTNSVLLIGNIICIPSLKWLNNQSNMDIISIFSHEYVHYLQQKSDKFFIFKYSFPLFLTPLSFILLILYPVWIVLLFLLVLSMPIYAPYRIKYEYDAYKMSILVNFCIINNRNKLPHNKDQISKFSDYILREFVEKTLFSWKYYSVFVPGSIKEKYLDDLKKWVIELQQKYFEKRSIFQQNLLASNQINSYIIGSDNIYEEVLNYLIVNQVKE